MQTALDIQPAEGQRKEVAPQSTGNVVPARGIDEMAFALIQSGADFQSVREMIALSKEIKTEKALAAFNEAMAAAKSEIPVIAKNRRVGYEHKNGGGETSYRHEDLGEIARTVDPILAKYGLSYRFNPQSEPNQPISVTCIISHRDGHSESTTLSAGRDDSGKKNSIQAIGSTITYLQRYTLKSALGLAASADDDGAKADEKADDTINEDQEIQLRELVEASGADMQKFLAIGNLSKLGDMPASQFKGAMEMLKERLAKRGAA